MQAAAESSEIEVTVTEEERHELEEIQELESKAQQLHCTTWSMRGIESQRGKEVLGSLDSALTEIEDKRASLEQRMARKGVNRISLSRTQSCPITYPRPELPTSPVGELTHQESKLRTGPGRRRSSLTYRTRANQIRKLHLDNPIAFLTKAVSEVISVLKDPSPKRSPTRRQPAPEQDIFIPAPVFSLGDLDDAPPAASAQPAPQPAGAAPVPAAHDDGPRPPSSPPPAHLAPSAPPARTPPPAPKPREEDASPAHPPPPAPEDGAVAHVPYGGAPKQSATPVAPPAEVSISG